MRITSYIIVLGIILLTSSFLYIRSHAADGEESRPTDPSSLIGKSNDLPHDHLLRALITAALSTAPPNVERGEAELDALAITSSTNPELPQHKESFRYNPDYLSKTYPWLFPHIFPTDGLPRPMATNKWVKQAVKISLGMPNRLEPFQLSAPLPDAWENPWPPPISPSEPPDVLADYRENYRTWIRQPRLTLWNEAPAKDYSTLHNRKDIEAVINDMAVNLSELSGIELSYIPPEQETLSDYAEIRINILSESSSFTPEGFKTTTNTGSASIRSLIGRDSLADSIKTGLWYTPDHTRQVSGFFLSNKDNEIQLAFCFIWDKHDLYLMGLLVSECLVRSMGFPGTVESLSLKGDYANYLSPWNQLKGENHGAITPGKPGELDSILIRTLYGTEIRPGMTDADITHTLLRTRK